MLRHSKAECGELQFQLTTSEAAELVANEKIVKLTDQVEELWAKADRHDALVDTAETAEGLRKEAERLVEEQKKIVSNLENDVYDLQLQLSKEKFDHSETDIARTAAINRVAELESESDSARHSARQFKANFERVEQELNESTRVEAVFNAELQATTRECKSLKDMMSKLMDELTAERNQVATAQAILDKERAINAKALVDMETLKTQVISLKEEKARLVRTETTLLQKLREEKRKRNSVSDSNHVLTEQAESDTKLVRELSEQLQSAAEHVKTLKSELDASFYQNKDLLKEQEMHVNRYSELRDRYVRTRPTAPCLKISMSRGALDIFRTDWCSAS